MLLKRADATLESPALWPTARERQAQQRCSHLPPITSAEVAAESECGYNVSQRGLAEERTLAGAIPCLASSRCGSRLLYTLLASSQPLCRRGSRQSSIHGSFASCTRCRCGSCRAGHSRLNTHVDRRFQRKMLLLQTGKQVPKIPAQHAACSKQLSGLGSQRIPLTLPKIYLVPDRLIGKYRLLRMIVAVGVKAPPGTPLASKEVRKRKRRNAGCAAH